MPPARAPAASDAPAWRRVAALLVVVAVTLVHLLLASRLPDSRLGSGAADTRPRRMEVSFVRDLAPTAPPAAAPVALRPAAQRRAPVAAAVAASAASAPAPELAVETAVETAVESAVVSASADPSGAGTPAVATAETALASAAPASAAAASAPAVAAAAPAAASAPAAFDWPPSTRLTYVLTGNVRGPVDGQAQVEWVRSGSRYQVHLDLSVGPSFAPLITRRITSDGELGEDGLRPRRYDEETKVALRDPRRLVIFFDDDLIRLPGGKEVPRPPGVQDTASQFVQLTWLFTLQPQRLERGSIVELPLALPRYVDRWTYEVLERETLATAAGAIETVHVKPRRAPRPGNELTAEMWIAPSLQYLPVRIVIRMDDQTWIDLLVVRLPQQAVAEPRGR